MSQPTSVSAHANSSIGITGLLTAILLVFKLAGMAGVSWGLPNLSWLWVFAPLAFGIVFSIVILFVVIIFMAFFAS